MKDIFNVLNDELNKTNNYKELYNTLLSWKEVFLISLLFTVLIITTIFILNDMDSFNTFSFISGSIILFSGVFFIVCTLQQLFSLIRTGKNPSAEIFEPILNSIEAQNTLILKLSCFNLRKIEFAINRIEYDISRISKRLGLLVGTIEKLGIIPLGIAVYFSAVKFFDSDNTLELFHIIALSFILGIYIGALIASSVLLRFDFLLFNLKEASKIKKSKDKSNFRNKKLYNDKD